MHPCPRKGLVVVQRAFKNARSSLLLILISCFVVSAQTTSPQSASAIRNAALLAVTGGNPVNDVTLTGSATVWTDGEPSSGPVTLQALGSSESRVELDALGGYVEMRDASGDAPAGRWVDQQGSRHAFASHNCQTDGVWFFPALSRLLSSAQSPNIVTSYVGQETWRGSMVQHVRTSALPLGQKGRTAQAFQKLSVVDYLLDANSLPVEERFAIHPDDDASLSIPVEVIFSNYKQVSGVAVPYRIQKYVNGILQLDISLQSASLNQGLQLSTFAIQ